MIEGQQMLTNAGPREFPKVCAWCSAGGAEPFEVEKARYGRAANGARVLKRRAIVAPACTGCRTRFEQQAAAGSSQQMVIQ